MHEDIDSQPAPQYLKVVNVLDFLPGYAGTANTGDKIGILTVEHNGEIEHPMLISLRDVKTLVAYGTMILAHHGDEETQTAILEHQKEEPPKWKMPTSCNADPCGVVLKVKTSPSASPMTFSVLWGYRVRWRDGPFFLLVRCTDYGDPHDLIVKIEGRNTIYLRGHLGVEALPATNWDSLAEKQPGHRFRIGDGPVFFKMAMREIKERLGRRVYKATAYRR